jgi:hypothetical protein
MKGSDKTPCSCRSRKKTFIRMLTVILAAGLLILPVSAHPPSDISLTYDELAQVLRVTITHTVPSPQEHYISRVTVTINGNVVSDSRYTSQPSPDTFTYTYPLETVTGDEIVVTASCVLAGSLSRTLYNTGPVAATPSPFPGQPTTQKAAAGLVPVLGASAVFLLRKK